MMPSSSSPKTSVIITPARLVPITSSDQSCPTNHRVRSRFFKSLCTCCSRRAHSPRLLWGALFLTFVLMGCTVLFSTSTVIVPGHTIWVNASGDWPTTLLLARLKSVIDDKRKVVEEILRGEKVNFKSISEFKNDKDRNRNRTIKKFEHLLKDDKNLNRVDDHQESSIKKRARFKLTRNAERALAYTESFNNDKLIMSQEVDNSIRFAGKHKKNEEEKKKKVKDVSGFGYEDAVPFQLSNNWTEDDSAHECGVLEERAAALARACEEVQLQDGYAEFPMKKLKRDLRWVMDYDLVYCPIFKSASTTWVKFLLEVAGEYMKRGNLHGKSRDLYPPPEDPAVAETFLDSAMRLIIVRNPLERLLSAYRDKMLRRSPVGRVDAYARLQQEIASTFRDPLLPSHVDPTPILPPAVVEGKAKQPTFNQFLLRVKKDVKKYWFTGGKHRINLHWRPYWATCSPCSLLYTAVAHLETLEREQEYILRDRGMAAYVTSARTHSSKFDSFNSTSEATVAYFSRVPRSLLTELVQLYTPDFRLFGYSAEYHLNLTVPSI